MSAKYHRMCKQAQEIQSIHHKKMKDYIAGHLNPINIRQYRFHTGTAIIRPKENADLEKLNQYTWIPDQKDYQQMISFKTEMYGFAEHLNLLVSFCEMNIDILDLNNSFDEIWLMIAMSTIYKKKWNKKLKVWQDE